MKNYPLAIVFAFVFSSAAFAGPVSHFGALKVCGNNICGGTSTTSSTKVQLKGPSLFWSDGEGSAYYRQEVVDWFVDEMKISIIRAAMAIKNYKEGSEPINAAGGMNGYLQNNKDGQKNLIKKVIDAAILNDIYVIVDWHSHEAHNETSEATAFFREMATEYKNVPNIIWEIYNEPVSAQAAAITSYSNTVIKAIRDAGNNNLVLIGSNFYSQKPSEQASNYGTTTKAQSDNVAFTFHFYAAEHPQSGGIGTSAAGARTAGYAVFGTEWGAVMANGDGSVNTSASDTWTSWMDNNDVSNCMWSASAALKTGGNANSGIQGSSMFKAGTNSTALSTSDLAGSGTYFRTYMTGSGKKKWTDYIPASHPKCKDITTSVEDGQSVTLTSAQLELDGDISNVSSVPFGELSIADDKKSITYKTSEKGSDASQVRFIYKVTKGSVTIQSKAVINITNRRPILPSAGPFNVSRRAPRGLDLARDLAAKNPSGGATGIEFTQVSVEPAGMGSAVIAGSKRDSVVFTPDPSQRDVELAEATLKYTVKNTADNRSASSSVVLKLKNMAPTGATKRINRPNTGPITLAIEDVEGKDADGDPLSFSKAYLHEQYPGTLSKSGDSYVYTPAPDKTGLVSLLVVLTDGTAISSTITLHINLTGTGSPIGTLTPPTQIPDHQEPDPCEIDPSSCEPDFIISRPAGSGSFGLKSIGSGRVELSFAQSGHANLEVYSLSGKKMGTLLNNWQNAGSSEVSLKNLNLQKGIYILRLKQGSQVKTLRIVN